jgi:hypothetical protein
MSQQELQQIQFLAMQFHLLVCQRKLSECGRCKAALLAKELSQAQYPMEPAPPSLPEGTPKSVGYYGMQPTEVL